MILFTRSAPCFLITLLCFCNPTSADLVLNFSDDNGASFANSFDVQTGDSLAIEIYLQQTAPDTVLTDDGLISWGLDLVSAPANLGTISNAMANTTSFDIENRNVFSPTGFEWEYGESANTGIRGNMVLLGSFQFDSMANGVSTFNVKDRLVGSGVGNASWFSSQFIDLDEQIFGAGATETFEFSVIATAVPEPGSMVVCCLAGLALINRRREA